MQQTVQSQFFNMNELKSIRLCKVPDNLIAPETKRTANRLDASKYNNRYQIDKIMLNSNGTAMEYQYTWK